ncbi:MAG: hypothetical protein K1X35_11930 [Caulobacteraceae bacterium]|nr:hypothetical protein [Caulobacteraceae bacterium]
MAAEPTDFDAQDSAEVFDEDNTEGDDIGLNLQERSTFEELPDVFDVTQRLGDGSADGRAYDDSEFEDGLVDDEDSEDDPLAASPAGADAADSEATEAADDEIELEFTPDVERLQGAQASAAHFESRRLTDEDLQQLGYQNDDKDAE